MTPSRDAAEQVEAGRIHHLGISIGKYRPDATLDDASDVRSRHDPADVRRKLEAAERFRRE